ncbi:MAG: TetR/AcrR family transcriptional regulator [candidate division Zixibacteria bacterium]|nr:TetR/AcrR family transcriptional regulator [candidate division Zixibacteria bacterium]
MNSEPESDIKREVAAKAEARGTRQKIVAAAIHEFAHHGIDGARIDRIAKSAKVNKAMIYYHFDSKDNLYLEVVTSFYKNIRQRAEEIVLPSETLEEALGALATLHETMFASDDYARPIMLREMADPRPEVLEAISAVFRSASIPQKIATLLGDGMDRGEYRHTDIHQALLAFASMSIYYHMVTPFINRLLGIDDPRQFAAERPKVIIDIFLNGLKVR